MKLQNLTVIFAIIVIPVSLILSAYIQVQIDTASLQAQYDTKLLNATHDAIEAFQLNTLNNDYSINSDSLRRDIKAALSTFTNSLSTAIGFGMSANRTVLSYIPAVVFTLYDGYYVYSPDLNEDTNNYEHVLKPYVYYSAKYVTSYDDIVVNYSLDNFITVYGKVNGTYLNNSGYVIDLDSVKLSNDGKVIEYDGMDISTETVGVNSADSNSVKEYYQNAYNFSKWLNDKGIYGIVKSENAVRADGKKYSDAYKEYNANDEEILRFSIAKGNTEEVATSMFNEHKRDIMRLSIQDNLNSAIANYNGHSEGLSTFAMPKLTEQDWSKILTNVNMISFMQGIQVGTKLYNNYAIITSTSNKQYVSPESLYFVEYDNTGKSLGEYHKINCEKLHLASNSDHIIVGYKGADFEKRRTVETNASGNQIEYYTYLHSELGCYKCIVNSIEEDNIDVRNSNASNAKQLKKAYYYALARERNNLYKTIQIY